jgi:hypothetical protein
MYHRKLIYNIIYTAPFLRKGVLLSYKILLITRRHSINSCTVSLKGLISKSAPQPRIKNQPEDLHL